MRIPSVAQPLPDFQLQDNATASVPLCYSALGANRIVVIRAPDLTRGSAVPPHYPRQRSDTMQAPSSKGNLLVEANVGEAEGAVVLASSDGAYDVELSVAL